VTITTISRRRLIALASVGAAGLLAACGGAAPTAAPAKPAESKPAAAAEPTKPAAAVEPTKPAAAAAAGAPTTAASGAQATAAPAAQGTTAPAAAKPAAAAKSGTTLRYHARTGSEADTLNDRLPEFTTRTGVEVKAETFPGGAEYYQKMQTLIAGGQLGDVLWSSLGLGWPIWGGSGVMRPLDDFVAQEKFDLGQYYKAAVEQFTYQGKLYGLPFKLQPGTMGLYYNADQVKELGKEPSLTMTHDDLIQMAKGYLKTSGNRTERWGFLPYWTGGSDTAGGWFVVSTYARAWGAELMNEDGTKSLLTEPKFKEAVTFMHELSFKHKVAPTYKDIPNSDHDGMFVAGNATMYQSGSWSKSLPTRVKEKFQVKDTLMPKGPSGSRGGMNVADMIAMNAKTQYAKESWELVKHLTDKETGVRLGEGRGGASGTSGGRPDVFADERLMKLPLHPVWKEAVESATPPRWAGNFRTAEYNQVLWQKMIGLLVGDEPLGDKFFNDLNSSVQQILDQPKP
jgi:ABC-type glycerol-3-phosphate transport system substrate-binding protein